MMVKESNLWCSVGAVLLKRIKFNTKLEHEYLQNYKVLQNTFKKVGVDKVCVLR